MNPNRVADLLASGLKPSQVATIIGVTPARISQLLLEPDFKLLLTSKTIEMEKKDVEEVSLSAKYSAAEHALVNQVMEMAPTSELRDVTAALRVVGERQERMKTRITPIKSGDIINNTIIALSLPSHALLMPAMEITKQGEVISIGDRTLAPLSSTAVTGLFAQMRNNSNSNNNNNETDEKEGVRYEHSPNTESSEALASKAVPSDTAIEVGFLSYAAG